MWGRWSPPTLRGACGVCIPTPGKFGFAHCSTYINFGAILCHFDSQRCIQLTLQNSVTNKTHSLNRYDDLYQINSTELLLWIWPIRMRCGNTPRRARAIYAHGAAVVHCLVECTSAVVAVPLPLALNCRGALPHLFFWAGGLQPPLPPWFLRPCILAYNSGLEHDMKFKLSPLSFS